MKEGGVKCSSEEKENGTLMQVSKENEGGKTGPSDQHRMGEDKRRRH